jgi:hypothetical protein
MLKPNAEARRSAENAEKTRTRSTEESAIQKHGHRSV